MRLIDADALEKAINKWMPKDMEAWADSSISPIENLVVSIMLTIEEQPTVNQWIPVSERLPEERERVLISVTNPNRVCISQRTDVNYWVGFGRDVEVLAWMPLPKFYEVEEE